MDDKFISDMVTFLAENVITPPGRWVLEQFGVRHPREHEIASLFTGIAFWVLVVVPVCTLVLGW
ncbi:hypothetical protein ACFQZO_23860 [Bradyrhizobium sp. GCM10027634]|uniref:hypothetical protein n=1 Tax=unclassified Bradyrhizobium TaxID=2631580 RepID=UPI00188BD843|nr:MULTISPECIES: hypothetical protein [unclassified Bradyrhizobium]MDN5003877.1 hypothetical protein [Bradyrhizobium sp. WYCCWR 12677]QOZ45458.1 hypothetical protein XH89_19690 [Bradyrhizobium sp. CCBAU 53340]